MNCNFTLTEFDMVSAMKLHGRGSNIGLMVMTLFAVIFLSIGLFTEYKAIGFGGGIGGLIGYFSLLLLVIPFRAKKQYRELRSLRMENSITLSSDGLSFKSEIGEGQMPWDDIHMWKYGNGIYLLYVASHMFHIVPIRAVSSSTELNQLLVENVGVRKA